MNKPHDPSQTADFPQPSSDALEAGLAAAFGVPRSSLGDLRPVLLKEAEGDSAHIVKPKSDAMPPRQFPLLPVFARDIAPIALYALNAGDCCQ